MPGQRIGAYIAQEASAAVVAGFLPSDIHAIGRWRSEPFRDYIRTFPTAASSRRERVQPTVDAGSGGGGMTAQCDGKL